MMLLRSALFNVVFYAVTFVMTLVATAVSVVAPHHVARVAAFWAMLMVVALRLICGIRVEVTGLQNIPEGAALIASRHQSAFDTFIWMILAPRCCYVLKQELLRIPLFGRLLRVSGMIAVDRSAGGAALRSLLRDGEQAAAQGRQIVIFPEGTRAEPGAVGALQSGIAALAARTRLPVIPVATDSGRCWGRKAFRKQSGVIHIVIGRPLPDSTSRTELMQALHSELGVLDRVAV